MQANKGNTDKLSKAVGKPMDRVDGRLTDALAAVTTKDIIGWFTHCCCYIPPN